MAEEGSQVSRDIKALILQGDWQPGSRLSPAEITGRVGASATVVREALATLVGDGLVTMIKNRGFFVREIDMREFRDVVELRCVVEGTAVKLAIERGDLDWETRVVGAHHRLSRIPRFSAEEAGRPSVEWSKAHRAFHATVIEAAEFSTVVNVARGLADLNELLRFKVSPTENSEALLEEEHRSIVDAIVERDADAAVQRLRSHYENGLRVVQQVETGRW